MNRIEVITVMVVVTLASWVVATALPAWSEVVWGGGILLLLVMGLVALTARAAGMRHPDTTPFQGLLRTSQLPAARPADLERIERLAGWVAYSEHDFSHRLKPLIVSLIRRRLEISQGVELREDEPIPAALLSENLNALIAPSSEGRASPIITHDLNRALDEIESL